MSIDILRLARKEAQAAWRWYTRHAGPTVAGRFQAALDDAISRVESTPLSWSPHLFGTRSCHLKRFPYHLVYLVEPNSIVVLAVAHFRRRPGYWSRRMP